MVGGTYWVAIETDAFDKRAQLFQQKQERSNYGSKLRKSSELASCGKGGSVARPASRVKMNAKQRRP
jgi:hypothetical protein